MQGSHHTLSLELHRAFSLRKDEWDSVALGRLQEATSDGAAAADLAAVLIKEGATGGLAHVVLVSNGMSIVRARLETNALPKQVLCAAVERAPPAAPSPACLSPSPH